MSYGNAIGHCGTQEDNSKYSSIEGIAGLLILECTRETALSTGIKSGPSTTWTSLKWKGRK